MGSQSARTGTRARRSHRWAPCVPVPLCGSAEWRGFHRSLERNLVPSFCGRWLRGVFCVRHFSVSFLPVFPGTEQDNVSGDNLGSIFLSTVLLVFPGRCLQLAFNVELRSLADVLSHDLGQTLPSHNVVPFCSVL